MFSEDQREAPGWHNCLSGWTCKRTPANVLRKLDHVVATGPRLSLETNCSFHPCCAMLLVRTDSDRYPALLFSASKMKIGSSTMAACPAECSELLCHFCLPHEPECQSRMPDLHTCFSNTALQQ